MKIIDCFMYFNEDLILDLRFNILNKFVDYFVIVESEYTHSGEKKKFNFDISKYSKYKDKIIYIKIEKKPPNLNEVIDTDNEDKKKKKQLINSLIIENYQRNYITNGIKNFADNDLILISDLDEIPNLSKINFDKIKNKIYLFKQIFFQYKLDLYLKDFEWFGTKACLKKNLKSPQWLRNIKNRKYPFYRIDTFLSNNKYINIEMVENGGWHFSNIMDEEKIVYKLKSFLHHADIPDNLFDKNLFKKLIEEKKIMYDHSADKSSRDKFKKVSLSQFDYQLLPEYIKENKEKFNNWLIIE